MKFVDEVIIHVRSGKGGDGAATFLREKFRPFGGPNGGDGGRGGDVVVEVDPQLGTLLDLKYRQHHRAEHGENGMSRQLHGRSGESHTIRVPVGTVVTDADTGEILADLSGAGARVLVARGGRGGRGNIHFATSTNQAPRHCEPGGPAEERRIQLTLKLLADVGLVGFPNAGKSTLISRLSAARPKVADYPFTTLSPKLGIVRTGMDHAFSLADIPGLIPGAAAGAGLGHQFLRHIERVAALAFLLEVSPEPNRHPVTDYEALLVELRAYSMALLEKPRIIVLNKADLPDTQAARDDVSDLAGREGVPFFFVSAVTGCGLDELAFALQEIVERVRANERSDGSQGPTPDSGS